MKDMKKYTISTAIMFICSLSFLASCDNSEKEDNLTPSQVYITNSGVQDINVYDTGESYTYPLGIYKAGALSTSAKATVAALTDAELSEYNATNGTNYNNIPANCYAMEYNVSFGSGQKDVNAVIDVVFDPALLKALPPITGNYVLPVKIVDSSISINPEKDIVFIRPTVKLPSIYFAEKGKEYKYAYGDFKATVFQAPIELEIDANKWDIQLEAVVDPAYVEEYGNGYTLLPADTYSFDGNISLANGAKNFTLKINVDGPKIDASKYLLPIRLKNSSKFDIDQERNIFFIALDISAPLINRSNWTIADFSTEEATGESGGENGKAIHLIDNNVNTFWHSRWNGGTDEMPHHVTIDMQQVYTITQVDLIRRQGNNDLRAGEFWLSEDNKSFVKAGSFRLEGRDDVQYFPVTPTDGRYLKLIFTESGNTPHTSLAEVMAHGY